MTTTPELWRINTGISPNDPDSSTESSHGRVVGLADGRILVTWVDQVNQSGITPGRDIFGRILDAGGNPVGDIFQLNAHGPANEDSHDIVATADGGFAVAYISYQGGFASEANISSLHFERFDAAGVLTQGGLLRSGTVGSDYVQKPAIETTDSDGLFISFMRGSTTGNNFTRGVVVSSAGVGGAEFQAGSNSDQSIDSDVARLSNGNIVVVNDDNVAGDKPKFTILTANGVILTGPTVVESPPPFVGYRNPKVAALLDGGFVVVYSKGGNASPDATRFAIYDNAGNVVKAPSEAIAGLVTRPDVVALPDGGFVVFNGSGSAQRFDSDGDTVGSTFASMALGTSGGVSADGRILVVGDLVSGQVGLRIDDPREEGSTTSGTSAADHLSAFANGGTVNGLLGDDVIYGRFGDDTLNGNNGNDTIRGDAGADTIDGGNHVDQIFGGAGNDTIVSNDQINGDHFDGGADFDTLDLRGANVGLSGVTIDLIAGTIALGIGAPAETLVRIEGIEATNNGDRVTEAAGRNVINLHNGADRLILGDPDFTDGDAYDGGGGVDTFDLSTFNWGTADQVRVNLGDGFVSRAGHTETLLNFENIVGGGGSTGEILVGSAAANRIEGNAGPDLLQGEGGLDTLLGGADNDQFHYGAVSDIVAGEVVDGGSGTDSIVLTGGGVFRLDLLSATSLERIDFFQFGTAARTARLDASQIGAGFTAALGIDGSEQAGTNDTLAIFLTTSNSVNLEKFVFADWGDGGDLVTITGDGSAETITGSAVADRIFGNGGADTIEGLAGADLIDGGGGGDTASYENSPDAVQARLSTNTGTGGHAEGDTFGSIENLTGSKFGDTLVGSDADGNTLLGRSGADTILGRGGDDKLFGEDGDDLIDGGSGADLIDGGDDTDTVSYAGSAGAVQVRLNSGGAGGDAQGDSYISIENVIGSAGADFIEGSSGANHLAGGGSADEILGLGGADVLKGEAGDDTLEGGGGADVLNGGADTDTVSYAGSAAGVQARLSTGAGLGGDAQGDSYISIENVIGSAFADVIVGSDGVGNVLSGGGEADTILGRSGDDRLNGDAGDDLLDGGVGADVLDGGADSDTASYAGSTAGVQARLTTGAGLDGDAQGDSYISIENLLGSAFNDTLVGSNAVNNRLDGGDGADTMIGNSGNDILTGGLGRDTLLGGINNDAFVFASAADSAVGGQRDVIYDFEDAGENDSIVLTGFAGVLTYIDTAAFSAANQVRVQQVGADVLVQINTTGTTGAESEILLAGTTLAQIDASDFFL